jgi:hypothetical protein
MDPATYVTGHSHSCNLRLKPQQDIQSQSNEQVQAKAGTEWGPTVDSNSKRSSMLSASKCNHPIELETEVVAETFKEAAPVKPQGKGKGNNKVGGRRKASHWQSDTLLVTNVF